MEISLLRFAHSSSTQRRLFRNSKQSIKHQTKFWNSLPKHTFNQILHIYHHVSLLSSGPKLLYIFWWFIICMSMHDIYLIFEELISILIKFLRIKNKIYCHQLPFRNSTLNVWEWGWLAINVVYSKLRTFNDIKMHSVLGVYLMGSTQYRKVFPWWNQPNTSIIPL